MPPDKGVRETSSAAGSTERRRANGSGSDVQRHASLRVASVIWEERAQRERRLPRGELPLLVLY